MGYTFTFCNRIEHTDLDLDRHRGASRPASNSATLRPVFVYITDCSDGCLATKRTIAAFLSHPPSRTMRLDELCIPAERRNDFRIEFFFVRSNRFCLRGKRVIVLFFFCSMWATILNVSSVFVFVIPTRARNNFVQNIACSVQFMFSGQTFVRPDSFFFVCYSPVRQHNLNYNK